MKDKPDFSANRPCAEYSLIGCLRLLALKETNPDLWSRVDMLMDHLADIRQDEKIMWDHLIGKISTKYREDELYRAIGVFITNGVNQGSTQTHGLYPTFSFISHDCVSNTRYNVHLRKEGKIVLRAQVDIPKGEEITIRYIPAFIGTQRRRFKLRNTWHFDCNCIRCSHPTELDTFNGALACTACSGLRKSKEEAGFNAEELLEQLKTDDSEAMIAEVIKGGLRL